MSKITKILLIAAVILLLSCVTLWNLYRVARKDVVRLKSNQEALVDSVSLFKTKSGEYAFRLKAVVLERDEFKKMYEKEQEELRDSKIRIKDLESLVKSKVEVSDSVVIELQEPVVKDSLLQQMFEFRDKFVKLTGSVVSEGGLSKRVSINYNITDTLTVYVYRVPKRFLCIPYGIKSVECVLKSSNPRAKVVAGECVLINKR